MKPHEQITAAVREAAAEPGRLRDMGLRARQAADRSYSGPTSLAYYRRLVTALLAGEDQA